MKIVQAVSWYFPESLGGTEVYVAGLSRRLRALGHEVLVAAPREGAEGRATEVHEGLTVFRYPIPARPTRDECQGRVPVRGAEHFHRWLVEEAPDVVHFHTFSTGLGLAEVLAAKATGAGVVATNHLASLGYVCQRGTLMQWGERVCDGICRVLKCAACEFQNRGLPKSVALMAAAMSWPLGGTLRGLRGKVGSAALMADLIRHNQTSQRQLLEVLDSFVLLNRWALEAVAANGAPREKLILNYLGLSQAEYPRKPDADVRPTKTPVIAGYFGRLVEIKGVYDLARAFSALPPDLPLRLEFRGPLGSRESERVLDRLRRVLGRDPRVVFAPPVPPSEAPRILAGYDVLIVPSRWFENGPTVMSEAHAVGTPVVGTKIGAMPEVISDGVNGRLVAPGDWRMLAEVLRQVALSPGSTVDCWRKALPNARRMDEIAADYLALYARIQARIHLNG